MHNKTKENKTFPKQNKSFRNHKKTKHENKIAQPKHLLQRKAKQKITNFICKTKQNKTFRKKTKFLENKTFFYKTKLFLYKIKLNQCKLKQNKTFAKQKLKKKIEKKQNNKNFCK